MRIYSKPKNLIIQITTIFVFSLLLISSLQISIVNAQPFRVKKMLPIGDGTRYLCATDNTFGNFIGRPYSSTEVVYTTYSSARRTALNKINTLMRSPKKAAWRRIYKQLAQCWNAKGPFAIDTSGIDSDTFRACDIINGIAPNASFVRNGTENKTDTIINGTNCSNQNTAVVELIINESNGSQGLCTGTVVNQRTIITAGHCLEGEVDSVDVRTKNEEFNTQTFHVHPNYGQEEVEINDVSVILMNEDLNTQTFDVLANDTLVQDELGIIGGYGLNENNRSEILRAAPVLIDSFTNEAIRIRYTGNNDFGNTCSGDSGGPLFVKRGSVWLLAGITSNGVKTNCSAGDLSNFSNLLDSSNKSFINTYVPGLIP